MDSVLVLYLLRRKARLERAYEGVLDNCYLTLNG
jgi:hypothetical protein